jgi:hypothetical protein
MKLEIAASTAKHVVMSGPVLAFLELALIAALKYLQQKRAARTVLHELEPLGTLIDGLKK